MLSTENSIASEPRRRSEVRGATMFVTFSVRSVEPNFTIRTDAVSTCPTSLYDRCCSFMRVVTLSRMSAMLVILCVTVALPFTVMLMPVVERDGELPMLLFITIMCSFRLCRCLMQVRPLLGSRPVLNLATFVRVVT